MMQRRHSPWRKNFEGFPGRNVICLGDHASVRVTCTRVGKPYWPHSILDLLGEGMNPDCEEGQFEEYLLEVSPTADRIVSILE